MIPNKIINNILGNKPKFDCKSKNNEDFEKELKRIANWKKIHGLSDEEAEERIEEEIRNSHRK